MSARKDWFRNLISIGEGKTTYGTDYLDGKLRTYAEYRHSGRTNNPDGTVTITDSTTRTYAQEDQT